jgi:predicted dehydrogenase
VIRVGIIGYGLAGAVFHAPLVDSVDGLTVAAIVTSDAERSRRAAEAYPDARVVATPDELWPLVDAVVVASPNRFHVPLGLAAVERDLPVVVDKPLAPSLNEAQRLVEAAEGSDVPLTVFQNRRWDGAFLTVRRLLPRVGTVRRFESRYDRWRPVAEGGWRQRGDPQEGGGLLLDLGSHLIDQALVLLGPARRVYAELDRRREGIEVDDDSFVAIEHDDGARSHLWMSAVAPLPGRGMRVSGTEGGIEISDVDPQEDQLADGLRPGDPGYGVSPGASAVVAAGDKEEREPLDAGAYQDFYAGFRDAVAAGGPSPVEPRDALAALRVIEVARASAADGTVVPVA